MLSRLRNAIHLSPDTRLADTHDYTLTGWGHSFGVDEVMKNGKQIRVHGWGCGLKVDDIFVCRNQGGGTTRYRIREIEYSRDPSDMWFARMSFVDGTPDVRGE